MTKNTFVERYQYYRRAQTFFIVSAFIASVFAIVLGLTTMFLTVAIVLSFLLIAFFQGLLYHDARKRAEDIEDFMLYYGLRKLHGKNKQTKI